MPPWVWRRNVWQNTGKFVIRYNRILQLTGSTVIMCTNKGCAHACNGLDKSEPCCVMLCRRLNQVQLFLFARWPCGSCQSQLCCGSCPLSEIMVWLSQIRAIFSLHEKQLISKINCQIHRSLQIDIQHCQSLHSSAGFRDFSLGLIEICHNKLHPFLCRINSCSRHTCPHDVYGHSWARPRQCNW